jgi:gluconate 2-dehydrogenase gamma chain
MDDIHSRRAFLRAAAAAGIAWTAADIARIDEALAWAAGQAETGGAGGLSILSGAQAEVIDAVASRILPSVDGRPGAHEAGVVYFIDRALATFNEDRKKLYADGIANLNRRAARRWKAASFAALTAARQDELLHSIEKTPFFKAARLDTIVGTFALPTWGGNRDYAGWHLLGLDHQARFQPPFGYYDAAINRRS